MQNTSEKLSSVKQTSIFDFQIKTIEGESISLSKFKGAKAFLIVNVACACGLTSNNYKQLVDIYSKYKQKGLQVFGFPCNQFYSQESGTHDEIRKFVTSQFGVTFPMFQKIEVNGQNTHALYRFLRTTSSLYDNQNKTTKLIPWNFAKFLLNGQGKVVKFYHSKVQPNQIIGDIQGLLKN